MSTKRMLPAAGLAVTLLFGGVTAATAAIIEWTVAAITGGGVPDPEPIVTGRLPVIDPEPGFIFPFSVDVQSSMFDPTVTTATAALTLSSNPPPDGGTEVAEGSATGTIDPLGFNGSSLGARSKVSTGDTVFPGECPCMFDGSIAGLTATLSNPLSGGATVDLMLHVGGSLILQNVAGAEAFLDCFDDLCELVSEVSASVSVLLALAEVVDLDNPELIIDPANPPFVPLFNGSLSLEVAPLTDENGDPVLDEFGNFVGFKPVLVAEGGLEGHVFKMSDGLGGACTLDLCVVAVSLDLAFTDVQSLGFGELFDVGFLLETFVHGPSEVGRVIDSNFGDTMTVALAFAPQQVPVSDSLLLLGLGLLGMGAARRRRTLH